MSFKMNKRLTPYGIEPNPNKQKIQNIISAGPCGGPGQPSCPDEFNKMVENSRLPSSYKNSLKFSDAQVTDNYVRPKHIMFATRAENERRVNAIKNDPGYKALTQNKAARKVVSRVDRYLDQAVNTGTGFYIPTMQESKKLLNIGRKYTGSKNIMKDMSLLDKGKAAFYAWQIADDYPNLERVARGHGFTRDKKK